MNIFYDHQIFDKQKIGGISRYFSELFLSNDYKSYHPVIYSDNEYIKYFDNQICNNDFYSRDFFRNRFFRGKTKLNSLLNKTLNKQKSNYENCIEKLDLGSFDLFHPTYYGNYFKEHLNGKPYVITIYDLIHEMCPGYVKLNEDAFVYKRELCENAERVICISDCTKSDLINIYGINDNKIDTIYLGSSVDPKKIKPANIGNIPSNYILFTGYRGIYKNFYFFLEAIIPLLKKNRELNVICSGFSFDQVELDFFDRMDVGEQLYSYYAKTDNELLTLYQRADLFVFPSLYEGFGMPILEAFSAKCPVLLSNTSCFPEIAADGAEYFNPYSITSIRSKVEEIIFSDCKKEELKNKGTTRLEDFSWDKTREQTYQTYLKAVEQC